MWTEKLNFENFEEEAVKERRIFLQIQKKVLLFNT